MPRKESRIVVCGPCIRCCCSFFISTQLLEQTNRTHPGWFVVERYCNQQVAVVSCTNVIIQPEEQRGCAVHPTRIGKDIRPIFCSATDPQYCGHGTTKNPAVLSLKEKHNCRKDLLINQAFPLIGQTETPIITEAKRLLEKYLRACDEFEKWPHNSSGKRHYETRIFSVRGQLVEMYKILVSALKVESSPLKQQQLCVLISEINRALHPS